MMPSPGANHARLVSWRRGPWLGLALETAGPDELEKEGAAWYEKRMRDNLEALAGVLK